MWVPSLGQEEPLEQEMATHSIILIWRIQWTEKPGELQSMGSQRVRHDWAHTHRYIDNVIMRVLLPWPHLNLSNFQRFDLQICSHWRLGLQHTYLKEDSSVHSTPLCQRDVLLLLMVHRLPLVRLVLEILCLLGTVKSVWSYCPAKNQNVNSVSRFIFLHVNVWLFQHHFLTIFASLCCLCYFVKDQLGLSVWVYLCESFSGL